MFWTLFIINNKITNIPIRTLNRVIIINMWLSSIILPIMCINTVAFIMFSEIIRTHFCFIMENIEIDILDIMVNEIYENIRIGVCKGTEILVFTILDIVWVVGTKTLFVFFWVVENFNSIVGFCAVISKWTAWFLDILYLFLIELASIIILIKK